MKIQEALQALKKLYDEFKIAFTYGEILAQMIEDAIVGNLN